MVYFAEWVFVSIFRMSEEGQTSFSVYMSICSSVEQAKTMEVLTKGVSGIYYRSGINSDNVNLNKGCYK